MGSSENSSRPNRVKNVLLNMAFFLQERNEMLEAEARHFKRSLTYTIAQISQGDFDETETKPVDNKKNTIPNGSEGKTRFLIECKVVYQGIKSLIEKTEQYQADVEEIIRELSYQSKNIMMPAYLEKILLLDCMRERSYSLAEKLEYFHQAYENIVSSHKFLHIPIPSISRRVKASNLMLYLDKKITEEYDYLSENFYKIKKKVDIELARKYKKKEKDSIRPVCSQVFSTWNFSAHDHLKVFDDTGNHYISFNFWLLEKQFFYPIAYHEVGHALYNDLLEHNKDTSFIKLGSEKADKLFKEIFLINKAHSKRQHAFVQVLWQDIIADLGAYIISGESYIHALFYTGFMRGIHKNFYKDIEQESLIKEERAGQDQDKRRCKMRHKDMTLLTWSDMDNDLISLFVRLHIMIDFHEEFMKEDNDKASVSDALQGIRDVMDMIYPRDKNNQMDENTSEYSVSMATATSISEKTKREYQFERSSALLAYHLLKQEVKNRKSLITDIKKLRKEKKDEFTNEREKLQDKVFYKKAIEAYPDINKFLHGNNQYIGSYYDFIWLYRYEKVNNWQIPKQEEQKQDETKEKSLLRLTMPSGRLVRFKNLYELGILDAVDSKTNLKNAIFEMAFIKFADNANMLNEFKKTSEAKKTKEKNINYYTRTTYAFGPYDYVYISEKTTMNVDEKLFEKDEEKDDEKKKPYINYFTERHPLYLLKEYKDGEKSIDVGLDFVIAYSSKNEFIEDRKEELTKELKGIDSKISGLQSYYNNTRFFASMGNENFIIYFENVDTKGIAKITEELIVNNPDILGHSYSSVLLNKDSITNDFKKYKQNILGENAIIDIHCKLKDNGQSSTGDETIEGKIANIIGEMGISEEKKPKAYRLYGVFDYKITFEANKDTLNEIANFVDKIHEYFADIQIEYQKGIISLSETGNTASGETQTERN